MRILRRLLVCLVILVALAGASLFFVYRASQAVPDFYTQALDIESDTADAAGDQLEQQVVELHNELERGSNWELVLTAEQVNGWLATDLEEKFPGLLPSEVHQPRVAFQDGTTHIACRVQTPKMNTVLSLALQPYLTDTPNELAIRVAHVRAGNVPVPLKGLLDRVAAAAMQAQFPLRWAQEEGDPVAIVQVPTEREDLRPGVVIETVRVEDGRLYVSGKAETPPEMTGAGMVTGVANYWQSNIKRQP